jgi:predicted nucleic-acid-binding Zn-ribbon protein
MRFIAVILLVLMATVAVGAVIYCPKCGSENVRIMEVKPEKPERMSMDALPGPMFTMQNAVVRFKTYRAVCGDCGYQKEYQQSY